MITWMQRHKKWLIITIWISTIAFVGAGFVGWGSYDYGKSDGTIAVVGDKEIPLTDLQNEYSTLYSQYQQMLGGNFNQELAKQFGLEKAALDRIIQKYLILNYAEDLNLVTTDVEVAQELVKINAFFKDGKFDSNTYKSVLKQNRRNATNFEAQLKKDLLVAKVQKIFNVNLEENEIKNLSTLLFSEDKVSIKIINSDTIKVNPSLKDLETYYEKNKENYKSQEGYNISYTKIANVEGKDKKQMKKIALKQYLALKKGNDKFEETQTVYNNTQFLSTKEFVKILEAKDGNVLKPIYKDENYYVVKLNNKITPQPLPFKDVKSKINKEYIASKKAELLDSKAKDIMKNFSGEDIGYINRNSDIQIKNLTKDETSKLIQNIFSSVSKTNYINLNNKIVVYKITDSRISTYDKNNDQFVKSSIQGAKTNLISTNLLDKLKNKYDVKSYLTE